jgi:hypothetical protein
MRVAAIMVVTVFGAGCTGLTRYEQSAAQLGEAATLGASAARGALGGAREACRMRAWLHAVSDRFERPGYPLGTDPLAVSSGVARAGGGTLTWGEYCSTLASQDEAVLTALSALEAYAAALKAVAAQPAALDTTLVTALATDVDGLAAAVGGSSTAVQAVSAPAGELARVVLEVVRTRRLRDAVRAGEGPLERLLAGLDAYLDAAVLELQDARSLAVAVTREADAAIPVRSPGGRVPPELPGQALALYEFSRVELARLDAAEAQLAATRKLLGALREAHGKLAQGARAGSSEVEVSRYVAGKLGEIVSQVIVLRRLDWRNP